MQVTPSELKYVKSHEWVRTESDGTVTVGITDHAQHALGDIVYVELPEVGQSIKAEEEAGVVESVKAASDIYSPISGEIIAVNESLTDEPEIINKDPYTEGWIFKVKPANASELENMLDADAYKAFCESED